MSNIVNPLIFRAKYFPYYKNEVDVFYNSKKSIHLLVATKKFYKHLNTETKVTGNIYDGLKKCTFCYINRFERQSDFKWKKLLLSNSAPDFLYNKIVVYKPYDLFSVIEYIIHYILKQLFNFKINLRKTLTKIMFLLINEYNLIGVKCILSGRIKGVQRAKREIFKLGESSVRHGYKRIKYCSSYVITKYGKWGVKLWLFI